MSTNDKATEWRSVGSMPLLANSSGCWWKAMSDDDFTLTPDEYQRVFKAREDSSRKWLNIRGHRVYLCGQVAIN